MPQKKAKPIDKGQIIGAILSLYLLG